MGLKLDLKKENKELFNVKKGEFKRIYCKEAFYLAIDGEGNPNNNEEYLNKISSLYKLAYKLKMKYKKQDKDFVVMPLSGLWWSEDYSSFIKDEKYKWKWTMMIQIPDYILEEDIKCEKVKLKEDNLFKYIEKIKYISYVEGDAFETLYVGPYSEEGDTVKNLHQIILEEGYELRGKHHEIYLSDPRRTEPSKLKTIIRQPVIKRK